MDWTWLNEIITIDKSEKKEDAPKIKTSFLDELVAGRPILSYPKLIGGFRLRYGRSRFTGIASKGVSPATMIITDGFIAAGTQLKMEIPGKVCVAAPVDSIEGPFVKLKNGDAIKINDTEEALRLKKDVVEIISIGDILITYGDFKKANAVMQKSSYVEEFWKEDAFHASGIETDPYKIGFQEAYLISVKYNVPIHPKWLYEFQAVRIKDIKSLFAAVCKGIEENKKLFSIQSLEIEKDDAVKRTLELLNIPHRNMIGTIKIEGGDAQSIIASLGICKGEDAQIIKTEEMQEIENRIASEDGEKNALQFINSISAFEIKKRSTYIGARIGRPEKAKERLMTPAANLLFPIKDYGGKDRNLRKAYVGESKKFGASSIKIEMGIYYCNSCKRIVNSTYCYDCKVPTVSKKICDKCKTLSDSAMCSKCNIETKDFEEVDFDIVKIMGNALKRVGYTKIPDVIKGVKAINNISKTSESIKIEKRRSRDHIDRRYFNNLRGFQKSQCGYAEEQLC